LFRTSDQNIKCYIPVERSLKYASFDVSDVEIEHRVAEIWLKQKMGAISKTILPLHIGIWRGSKIIIIKEKGR
jgi:hypothetical protein